MQISSKCFYFLKKVNTLIHQGHIKLIKSPSKIFIIFQKIYISNRCCSLQLSIHLLILKNQMYHSFNKILCSTTVFNIDNNIYIYIYIYIIIFYSIITNILLLANGLILSLFC